MRRLLRATGISLVAGMLGLVLAVVPSQFSPEQAHAITVAPDAPYPVNVLPSTVQGGAPSPIQQATAYNKFMAHVYKNAKDPTFWAGVEAAKEGRATAQQTALLTKEAAEFRVPAMKPTSLVKTAGGVGAAIATLDVAIWAGNGVATVLGFNPEGNVCPTFGDDVGGSIVRFASGVDCAGWDFPEEFVPNLDADGNPSSGMACNPAGTKCAAIYGMYTGLTVGSNPNQTAYQLFIEGSVGGVEALFPDGVWRWVSYISSGGSGAVGSACKSMWGSAKANSGCIFAWSTSAYGSHGTTAWAQAIRIENGLPQEVLAGNDNPGRTLECVIALAGGGTISKATEEFSEAGGVLPKPSCPAIPQGAVPHSVQLDLVGGGQRHPLGNQETTPEFRTFQQEFPECGSGTCMLDLRNINESCFANPAACANWYADPNKTETYTCYYGGKVVPLEECNIYAPSFDPNRIPGRTTYGSPATPTTPLPSPVPNPGPDPGYFNAPIQDPAAGRECFPTGWAVFNPVEWVLRPVQCALEWAFVPRADVAAGIGARAETILANSGFGSIPPAINALVAPFLGIGPGSCEGPPWRIAAFGFDTTMYPFSACDEPVKGAAVVVKGALTFGVVALSILALVRYVTAIIGFVPFGGTGVAGPASSKREAAGND